jgi:hypothetical protein
MKVFMIRQGDLVLESVKALPKRVTQVKDGVILRGVATGHAHAVQGGTVWKTKDMFYVKVAKKAKLVHDEHKTIELPKGIYQVIRQKEYVTAMMSKIVQD